MSLNLPETCAQSSQPGPASKAPTDDRSASQGDAARTLSSEVNNPTAPLSLIQFCELLAPSVPGADGPAKLFEIQPVLPIASSHIIPFDQLIKITLPIETAPVPNGTTGLGDLQFFDLVAINQSWGRWGLGPMLVFPTATSDVLGQGKWQAGVELNWILTGHSITH